MYWRNAFIFEQTVKPSAALHVLKRCIKAGVSLLLIFKTQISFSTYLIFIFLQSIFWSLPLPGSLSLLSSFGPVSATELCFPAVFPLIHFTPFVFSSCTTLCITTPLPPPSPLFLPLLHLIIHHSQIWLNVLSWRGWNLLSLSFCLFLHVSLSLSPSLSVVMETGSSN